MTSTGAMCKWARLPLPDLRVPISDERYAVDDLFWLVMQPVCDAFKPWDESASWSDLSPGQLAVYALWLTESTVQQEGFHGFLWNQAGFQLEHAVIGARLIEADQYLHILEAVLSIFPLRSVPRSARTRRELLLLGGDTGDDYLNSLDHDFYELLKRPPTLRTLSVRYIEAHPDDFFISQQ